MPKSHTEDACDSFVIILVILGAPCVLMTLFVYIAANIDSWVMWLRS